MGEVARGCSQVCDWRGFREGGRGSTAVEEGGGDKPPPPVFLVYILLIVYYIRTVVNVCRASRAIMKCLLFEQLGKGDKAFC